MFSEQVSSIQQAKPRRLFSPAMFQGNEGTSTLGEGEPERTDGAQPGCQPLEGPIQPPGLPSACVCSAMWMLLDRQDPQQTGPGLQVHVHPIQLLQAEL
jgi:hypothetical protein